MTLENNVSCTPSKEHENSKPPRANVVIVSDSDKTNTNGTICVSDGLVPRVQFERNGAHDIATDDIDGARDIATDDIDGARDIATDDIDVTEPVRREDAVLLEIQETQRKSWVPDGGWGWMIVLGAFIVHVYIGGLMKASGIMYMKLQDRFQQSAVATAWVFSLFTTFLLMMGPVASALCHRFSCRTVVFFGSIVAFLGMFVSAFAPNIEFLYFSYAVVGGFGRCLTYTPSLILVTGYFDKRRGLAVGISTAGVGLGMFSFPPLLEALFSYHGYQGAMILLSAISLQTFICAALFRSMELHKKISKTSRVNELVKMARRGSVDARLIVQEVSTPKPRHRAVGQSKGDDWHGSNAFSSTTEFTFVVAEPRRKSLFYEKIGDVKVLFKSNIPKEERKPILELSLLKDFPFLSLCVSMLLFTMSMMSTFVFLPPLAKSKGVSQLQSAYLVSIIGVSDSIARFTSGFLLDLKRIKPYRLLVYNAVMFGVGIVSVVMPSIEGFAGFVVISLCYGALAGTYVAQKSVVVVDVLGLSKMTSSFGLLLWFQGIGSLVGPTISGLFRDVYGTYDEAFYFGGIGIFFGGCVLLCGNIVKLLRDRRARRSQQEEQGEGGEEGKEVRV
ncbi:monocarboxylate transporter 13-like isoform X1 [Dreissena polymorpha]|uniref:monocarboxylate transporter 13-like isoform X1 n=1 Tax=Dreissena polymorpha TaxID=45954 RepID=UPI002264BD20|nr:monocarboxylate transporter 13-like isoform X1 [Dreissena polymorpha]